MIKITIFLTALLTISEGYGQKTKDEYFHPMFKQIAVNHKTMAVLPFKFNAELLKQDLKEITEEQLKTMERIDGQLFQNSVYEYLKKKEEGPGLRVELQNVNVTNEILKNNNITPDDIVANNMKNIASLLGVDVLIFGNMTTAEPFSQNAAIALTALNIASGGVVRVTAHEATGVMQITDANSGTLLWRYKIKIAKGVTSSSDGIVEKIMGKSARNIPYIK